MWLCHEEELHLEEAKVVTQKGEGKFMCKAEAKVFKEAKHPSHWSRNKVMFSLGVDFILFKQVER